MAYEWPKGRGDGMLCGSRSATPTETAYSASGTPRTGRRHETPPQLPVPDPIGEATHDLRRPGGRAARLGPIGSQGLLQASYRIPVPYGPLYAPTIRRGLRSFAVGQRNGRVELAQIQLDRLRLHPREVAIGG